jgi:hypothetical protein
MAGLVPAIPIHLARLCPKKRDRRAKPGDDKLSGGPWDRGRTQDPVKTGRRFSMKARRPS